MGIKYTGTGYLSSALAMDKGITKQMFLMNNVPVSYTHLNQSMEFPTG